MWHQRERHLLYKLPNDEDDMIDVSCFCMGVRQTGKISQDLVIYMVCDVSRESDWTVTWAYYQIFQFVSKMFIHMVHAFSFTVFQQGINN